MCGSLAKCGNLSRDASVIDVGLYHLIEEDAHAGGAGEDKPVVGCQLRKRCGQLHVFCKGNGGNRWNLKHFRPLLVQARRHGGGKVGRACDQHLAALEGLLFIPSELVSQSTYAAHDNDCRSFDLRFGGFISKACNSGDDTSLTCGCSFLQNGCRGSGIHSRP